MLAVGDRVRAMTEVTELLIPFDRGDVMAAVHREGQVLVESPDTDGVRVRARLEAGSVGRLREFVVE
jgi:GTP-binding protein HflX